VLPGLVFMTLSAYAASVLRAGGKLPPLIKLVLWANTVISAFLGLLLLLAGGYVGVLLDSSRFAVKYATGQMLLASSAGIDILLIAIVRSILSVDGRSKLETGSRIAVAGFAACISIDVTQVTLASFRRLWSVYSVYLPLAASAAQIMCCTVLFRECQRLRRNLTSGSGNNARVASLHKRLVFAGSLAAGASVASFVATSCYSYMRVLSSPAAWAANAVSIITSRALLSFGHVLFCDSNGAYCFAPTDNVSWRNSTKAGSAASRKGSLKSSSRHGSVTAVAPLSGVVRGTSRKGSVSSVTPDPQAAAVAAVAPVP
jgi:hypothetical protein